MRILDGHFMILFVADCNPVKFWIVSRHGTRLPTAKAINYMRELTDVR